MIRKNVRFKERSEFEEKQMYRYVKTYPHARAFDVPNM